MLDLHSFETFSPFLREATEYANSRGYRFQKEDLILFRNSSPVAADLIRRLQEKVINEDLATDIAIAKKCTELETIRMIMIVTFKELELWPANAAHWGLLDSRVIPIWQDISDSMEDMCLTNFHFEDMIQSGTIPEYQSLTKTSSFVIDLVATCREEFADSDERMFEFSEESKTILVTFLSKAKQWEEAELIRRNSLNSMVSYTISDALLGTRSLERVHNNVRSQIQGVLDMCQLNALKEFLQKWMAQNFFIDTTAENRSSFVAGLAFAVGAMGIFAAFLFSNKKTSSRQ